MDLEGEEASSSLVAASCSSPDVSAVSDAALFYPVYDDFESDTRKQAAADALSHFSQFAMVCISKGVEPSRLKLHLMKEVSGMPTSLDGEQFSTKSQTAQDVASSSSAAASVSVDDMQLTQSDDRMQS